jgi:hypothetical protein
MATILLVVGNSAALTTGDTAVSTRLSGTHGHTVVVASDEDAEYGGAYDGFVVCDSVAAATFGSKYSAVAKPCVLLDNGPWDDYGMCVTTAQTVTQTNWTVLSAGDLDASLSGDTVVYSSAQSQAQATISTLGSGVQVVAQLTSDTTRSPFFAYESGATQSTGTAPARRVAFGVLNAAVGALNADGTALLDAAFAWAFSAPAGGGGVSAGRAMLGLL